MRSIGVIVMSIAGKTGEDKIPDAKLIFNRSVETVSGPREIQLYWGNFVDLINSESCVLISSNTIQEQRGEKPAGMAWRSLQKHLDLKENLNFKRVLEAGPDSAVWPISASLEEGWDNVGHAIRPYIDCADVPHNSARRGEFPRKIFCLHTLPFQRYITTDDDYKYALGACLAAIRSQEAIDLTVHNIREPYQDIVMTALAGRQSETPHELLNMLMQNCENWFIVSPRIKTIKVCFWNKKIQRDLDSRIEELDLYEQSSNEVADIILRKDLLELLDEQSISSGDLQSNSTKYLISEFREGVENYLQDGLSAEVNTALSNMYVILGRSNPTVLEIGGSAGRLAEGLVNHLYEAFFDKRPSTFHNGIEDLAMKSPTSEKFNGMKISSWYKSYLHTLRILRNTCAHSHEEQESQYPNKLETADIWILIVNLKRVLELHIKLLKGNN